MNIKETQRYPNFDLLRLFLALEVVIAHAFMLGMPELNLSIPIMAVPAFLAVSGVVVLKSYGETNSLTIFAKKRATRILPALAASIILIFLLFDWVVATNSIITWITAGIYIPSGYTNQALWSLAWEELAYLILASLWAAGAYKKPAYIWFLLACSMIAAYWTSKSQFSPYTQTVPLLAQAFFVGNIAFLYRDHLYKLGALAPWVLFAAVIFWRFLPLPPGSRIVAPHLVQVFSVVWLGIAGGRLVKVKFPDISYGVYIYHMPILLLITEKLRITDITTIFILLSLTLIPTCLASWYIIEKPAINKISKAISTLNAYSPQTK